MKTKKYSRETLRKEVKSILEGSGNQVNLIFSMGESSEDCETITHPDLKSKEPVYTGQCVFFKGNYYRGRVLTNPTWKDILIEANWASEREGDHRFLESVDEMYCRDDIRYFEFFFGS